MATDAERANGRVGQDDSRAGGCLLGKRGEERALAGERHAHQPRLAALGAAGSACWADVCNSFTLIWA